MKSLERVLPLGASVAQAEATLRADGLRFNVVDATACRDRADEGFTGYAPEGGPCIFGTAPTRECSFTTGYCSSIHISLSFDASGVLVRRDLTPKWGVPVGDSDGVDAEGR